MKPTQCSIWRKRELLLILWKSNKFLTKFKKLELNILGKSSMLWEHPLCTLTPHYGWKVGNCQGTTCFNVGHFTWPHNTSRPLKFVRFPKQNHVDAHCSGHQSALIINPTHFHANHHCNGYYFSNNKRRDSSKSNLTTFSIMWQPHLQKNVPTYREWGSWAGETFER